MQHFFVPPSQVEAGKIVIQGRDVNHMKNVLRMKSGERVMVSDGNNRQYVCEVVGYEESDGMVRHEDRQQALLRILEETCADTELPSRIYLFQGLPKQEKMELIVQKCVELGVYEVIPTMMRRSVVRLDGAKAEKKRERWQQIAESAAKQAGRGIIPQVAQAMPYDEALKKAGELDVLLFPYELASGMEETKKTIAGIRRGQSVGILIGPEGGFEKEEAKLALRAGAKEITLGRRILRTETAGLAVLSVLMFHLEEE